MKDWESLEKNKRNPQLAKNNYNQSPEINTKNIYEWLLSYFWLAVIIVLLCALGALFYFGMSQAFA